jgi:hypothetical protein
MSASGDGRKVNNMKIVQSGEVSMSSAETATNGGAIGAAITAATMAVKSFATVVGDLLAELASAAVIVVNPNTRKVTAATGGQAAALIGVMDGNAMNSAQIVPDGNQTGRSLTWEASQSLSDLPSQMVDAVNAAIQPAKPRRSVESLVSAILTAEFGAVAPVIVIDQREGKVFVCEPGNDPSAWDTALASAKAGDQVSVEISDNSPESDAPKLVFEGGAV